MMRLARGAGGFVQHSGPCCVPDMQPSRCILALVASSCRVQPAGCQAASRLFATSDGSVQYFLRVRDATRGKGDSQGRCTAFWAVLARYRAARMHRPGQCCIRDRCADNPDTANPPSLRSFSRPRARKNRRTQNVSDHSNATFAAFPGGAEVVAHVQTIRRGGSRVTP